MNRVLPDGPRHYFAQILLRIGVSRVSKLLYAAALVLVAHYTDEDIYPASGRHIADGGVDLGERQRLYGNAEHPDYVHIGVLSTQRPPLSRRGGHARPRRSNGRIWSPWAARPPHQLEGLACAALLRYHVRGPQHLRAGQVGDRASFQPLRIRGR
jgi:hypothetical protein